MGDTHLSLHFQLFKGRLSVVFEKKADHKAKLEDGSDEELQS